MGSLKKMIDDGYYFDENFISMKNLRKIEKLKYDGITISIFEEETKKNEKKR